MSGTESLITNSGGISSRQTILPSATAVVILAAVGGPKLMQREALVVALGYGQFYLHTAANDPELPVTLLEQAQDGGGIAQTDGLIMVESPHQNNFASGTSRAARSPGAVSSPTAGPVTPSPAMSGASGCGPPRGPRRHVGCERSANLKTKPSETTTRHGSSGRSRPGWLRFASRPISTTRRRRGRCPANSGPPSSTQWYQARSPASGS